MSPTTRDLLIYYCMRAHQSTGQTNVSVQKTSQDLELRKDHVDEHDRKLARGGYIKIEKDENGGRIVQLCGPWQSSEQRKKKSVQLVEKKDSSQELGKPSQDLGAAPQDSGSPLNSSPRFGENPQDLGNATQNLGESTQNLGKTSQNLGAHIRNNQPMNQPMNQPAAERVRATATTAPAAAEDRDGDCFSPVTLEGQGDPLQDRLDALFRVVQGAYRFDRGNLTRSFEAQINEQVANLNALGATPDSLPRFFSQRRKLPTLKYLASDYQTWAVDLENLTVAGNGANGSARDHRYPANGRLTKSERNEQAFDEAEQLIFGKKADYIDAEEVYESA